MGSFFEVRLPEHAPGAVELATRALDVIETLEGRMTIYRDDSEISRLNATAHLGPVEVEPRLFDLIARAVTLGRETDGAYDIASGALSLAWGFIRGPRRVPDAETLTEARERTGIHHLTLDPECRTVAFDRPGIVLNFGSIGKGYALDRAVDVIRDHWWPTPALVHGGQSSIYALGTPPLGIGARWEIALKNPFRPEMSLGTLRLRNRGVGTSGAAFQNFVVDGVTYGHILDPRTGQPATGTTSVTVVAPTAAEADALSTAFYLLGPERSEAYMAKHSGVAAIFVRAGSTDAAPEVLAFGLEVDAYRDDPALRWRVAPPSSAPVPPSLT